jgi:hypothetical protein
LICKINKALDLKNEESLLINYEHENQPYTIKCDQTLQDFIYFVGKNLYVKNENGKFNFDPISPLKIQAQMVIYDLSVTVFKKKDMKSKSFDISPSPSKFLIFFLFIKIFFIFEAKSKGDTFQHFSRRNSENLIISPIERSPQKKRSDSFIKQKTKTPNKIKKSLPNLMIDMVFLF